jgi:hypothetical protein
MFDSDSPFPQAIPAFADCCKAAAVVRFHMSFVLAGAMVIAVPLLFHFGWHDPPIVMPQFLKRRFLFWPA